MVLDAWVNRDETMDRTRTKFYRKFQIDRVGTRKEDVHQILEYYDTIHKEVMEARAKKEQERVAKETQRAAERGSGLSVKKEESGFGQPARRGSIARPSSDTSSSKPRPAKLTPESHTSAISSSVRTHSMFSNIRTSKSSSKLNSNTPSSKTPSLQPGSARPSIETNATTISSNVRANSTSSNMRVKTPSSDIKTNTALSSTRARTSPVANPASSTTRNSATILASPAIGSFELPILLSPTLPPKIEEELLRESLAQVPKLPENQRSDDPGYMRSTLASTATARSIPVPPSPAPTIPVSATRAPVTPQKTRAAVSNRFADNCTPPKVPLSMRTQDTDLTIPRPPTEPRSMRPQRSDSAVQQLDRRSQSPRKEQVPNIGPQPPTEPRSMRPHRNDSFVEVLDRHPRTDPVRSSFGGPQDNERGYITADRENNAGGVGQAGQYGAAAQGSNGRQEDSSEHNRGYPHQPGLHGYTAQVDDDHRGWEDRRGRTREDVRQTGSYGFSDRYRGRNGYGREDFSCDRAR